MKVWEGKQVIGFLLTWRLLRHQVQQQTTDKYNRFQVVAVSLEKPDLKYQMWVNCRKPNFSDETEVGSSFS